MAHTFFSIVIVSLNPGQKLMKTLQSVLRQEYGNFEVILKDGGSTDGSLKEEADGSPVCGLAGPVRFGQPGAYFQESG